MSLITYDAGTQLVEMGGAVFPAFFENWKSVQILEKKAVTVFIYYENFLIAPLWKSYNFK